MTAQRRPSHTAIGAGAILMVAGMLAGCTPKNDPDPTPTPTTAFASEEEAFAAAEEVYQAYNEAVNARIREEESPDPQDLLTGTALEDDIDGLEIMRSNGVRLSGEIDIASFSGTTAQISASDARVIATVCLDVSGTEVLDDSDTIVTPSNRPAVVAQEVTLVVTQTSSRITNQAEAEASAC